MESRWRSSVHMNEVCYVGLGSNVGDRLGFLADGARALASDSRIAVVHSSSVYESAPIGYLDQGDFLNAVLRVRTTRSATSFLQLMMEIEDLHGRQRTIHWGPRNLDLDLRLFGNCVINTPRLRVPHPHMNERRFVLQPLLEISPELVHPQSGRSMAEYLYDLSNGSVRKMDLLRWN